MSGRRARGVMFIVAAFCGSTFGSEFGRDGFSGNPNVNNGSICSACHATGAGVPNVILSGPQTVDAGTTQRYKVTIRGGPGVTGGMGVSATNNLGTFKTVDTRTRLVGEEISHRRPRSFSGNEVSFSFDWQAPTHNATVRLYAAGNSSNGQQDLLGDGIGTDTLRIEVVNGDPPPPPEPSPPPADARLDLLLQGLDRPNTLTHAGDARLFIVEQSGRILIVDGSGNLLSKPFLDIRTKVYDRNNEQGLLGLAFHPNYATNGFFYVYYTRDPGSGNDRSRVSRFKVSSNRNVAAAASERVLLEFAQSGPNHNAGDLKFGPDGFLYIASGDGGGAGDKPNNAQNRQNLLGKILRIDVNGSNGSDCDLSNSNRYSIPAGNPFSGSTGCSEIWALGVRNPWRMSFDRATGDLWIADVGQNRFEEVNRIAANTAGGLNLGWRCYEGQRSFNLTGCNDDYYFPERIAKHTAGACSITGGFVYRGSADRDFRGRYFYTDFCDTTIRTLTPDGSSYRHDIAVNGGEIAQPVSFGEDVDGELYVITLPGDVYQLRSTTPDEPEPPPPPPPPPPSGGPIAEAGLVTMGQGNTPRWRTRNLNNTYADPIVVMGAASFAGEQALSVRVKNVGVGDFQWQIKEWDYLDQAHFDETVGYIVAERGDHQLSSGHRLVAGSVNADHRWKKVNFATAFASVPVVMAQVSSVADNQTVTERIRNVTKSGFEVRLQEEEGNDDSHSVESVDWIAVSVGGGGGLQSRRVTGINNSTKTVSFPSPFASTPVVITDMQTFEGPDTATLRLPSRTKSSFKVLVHEEQSADNETRHLNETVGYLGLPVGNLE